VEGDKVEMSEPRGARMAIQLVASATTKLNARNRIAPTCSVTDKGKTWGNNIEYYSNQGILSRKVAHNTADL
jgi:hypothetical protein